MGFRALTESGIREMPGYSSFFQNRWNSRPDHPDRRIVGALRFLAADTGRYVGGLLNGLSALDSPARRDLWKQREQHRCAVTRTSGNPNCAAGYCTIAPFT